MAKKLIDNFAGSKWVGPKTTLTPQDKTGTPEDFEKLYDRRAPRRAEAPSPRPKLKAIESSNMADRLAEHGLSEEVG